MNRLREDGVVRFIGLTGTGQAAALREVVRSSIFDTLQVPFNILNPSAGLPGSVADGEVDFGEIIGDCQSHEMGVFAIRVFAGGALLDRPPSAHTLTTPYFPLALYERDRARARELMINEKNRGSAGELALRFVLGHEGVASAIIGFGDPSHIDEAVRFLGGAAR
jgi:aryl-alcohol dehydrogenase-like predicted oxidoreductase